MENEIPKGEPGGECARSVCNLGPAVGFNRATGAWYCRKCSALLNYENKESAMQIYNGPLVILPETASIRPDGGGKD